ncbi:YCF48-related protein [candidate division KSB1 bacterium]|nr:YCF48-related protein [candidate division KSB1 bacterium]
MRNFFSKFPIIRWFILPLIFIFGNVIWALESSFNPDHTNILSSKSLANTNDISKNSLPASPLLNILNAVSFLNEKAGWIVGSEGKILHTEDGGRTWHLQSSNTQVNLLSLSIFDARNVWAAGEQGVILYWDGTEWTRQASHTGHPILNIHFRNRTNGLAIATSTLLTTSNSGQEWQPQALEFPHLMVGVTTTPDEKNWLFGGLPQQQAFLGQGKNVPGNNFAPVNVKNILWDLEFVNSREGWAVGFGNTILHTSNGGLNWERQSIPSEQGLLYNVDFTDSLNGWVISQAGEIFQTVNGGHTWTLNAKVEVRLCGLHFNNKTTGWVVGGQGTILNTVNGGKTWQTVLFHDGLYLSYFKGAYCVIARETIAAPRLTMHIPVISEDAAPLAFRLEETTPPKKLRSYRTVSKAEDNWVVELTFNKLLAGDSVFIPWQSWVLKRGHNFRDIPDSVDLSMRDWMPDSVKSYLRPSKIIQSKHPLVVAQARKLAGRNRNILTLANTIINFTGNELLYQAGNEQDALATLKNGYGVCNGKANVAVALFRALGIPARTLMVANTHFVIEYYLPLYGWVRAEATSGRAIEPTENNTVMWIASPRDEDASPYSGVVCYWGTGDRRVLYDILYDQAEQNEFAAWLPADTSQVNTFLNQTKSVWRQFNRQANLDLNPNARSIMDQARHYQLGAVEAFSQRDITGFARQLELAQRSYERISLEQATNLEAAGDLKAQLFQLSPNYPNPFNSKTLIRFSISKPGQVILRIFNVAGQEVKLLVNEFKNPGIFEVTWNATDRSAASVASGIYFFQLDFHNQVQKQKAILLR